MKLKFQTEDNRPDQKEDNCEKSREEILKNKLDESPHVFRYIVYIYILCG